jgi:formate dehydrogenase subunit delta
MSGGPDRLVYMANQIAAAFRAQGRDVAVQATLDHLVRFWDPGMRRALKAHVDRGGGGLNDIALAAGRRLEGAIGRGAGA